MNDFDKAAKNIGNRFDMVLVACERMRELHRKRREQEDLEIKHFSERKTAVPPCVQSISDIENKIVGREYLFRVKDRSKKKKIKFDEL
jgi:DNA-directed RNA polymerase subunit K/omega